MTLKDDTTASKAPTNSIQACIKGINVAPPCEHTDPGIYKVGDAVWVKTHVFNVLHIPFSSMEHCIISDLHLQQRSALSKDDDSDKSSERESNALLFFSLKLQSSAESEEMDSGDNNDHAKNEGS